MSKNRGSKKLSVLMVAAECRGIAKVGGLADVVFDLSQALRLAGHEVHVIIPCYEVGAVPPQAKRETKLDFLVRFEGEAVATRLVQTEVSGLVIHLIEAPLFRGEEGSIYVDSQKRGKGPFEDDARRFAFFSAAVWDLVKHHPPFSTVQVLHCHDWHTSWIPLLAKLDNEASRFPSVFTIHNLDYQGTRPWDEPYAPGASWRQWFPERWDTLVGSGWVETLSDPQAPHCFNPMRCGIRMADAVNTVSPSYALEITQPDDPASNFIGGRGLEADLLRRQAEGRLWGILNGLDYHAFDPDQLTPPYNAKTPDLIKVRRQHRDHLWETFPSRLESLVLKHGSRFGNSDRARAHLSVFLTQTAGLPLTVCVTRAVSQKLGLFTETLTSDQTVAQAFLTTGTALLVIGSGELQDKLEPLNDEPTALFLQVFDAEFATTLYAVGDLFLMPSDFEPCGISQLMALRFGCLPLVHNRGGLHDTVRDGQTGFVFEGTDRASAKREFLATSVRAVATVQGSQAEGMIRQAMTERFEWTRSVVEYEGIYRLLARK